MEPTESQTETPSDTGVIVAKPDKNFRVRRYLMTAIIVGSGLWFAYDGFVKYPRENAKARAEGRDKLPYPGFDEISNKLLGCSLPPIGIAFLIWVLHNSRGQYRFDGTSLEIPGHPPITMPSIRRIDKTKWDKKGIAFIEYNIGGKNGWARIDDFIYEQKPTDQIMEKIEAAIKPVAPAAIKPAQTTLPPRPSRPQVK